MRWLEMANLLYDKSNPLSPTGAHLHLDTAGWMRTWTPHQNRTADWVARQFSKHLEWPLMDADTSCQLYFRCLFAIDACIQRDAQGMKPPRDKEDVQQVLESLLVEAWQRDGVAWAEQRYQPPQVRFGGVRVRVR